MAGGKHFTFLQGMHAWINSSLCLLISLARWMSLVFFILFLFRIRLTYWMHKYFWILKTNSGDTTLGRRQEPGNYHYVEFLLPLQQCFICTNCSSIYEFNIYKLVYIHTGCTPGKYFPLNYEEKGLLTVGSMADFLLLCIHIYWVGRYMNV